MKTVATDKSFRKATKHESRKRVLEVIGLMEKSWTQRRITEYCAKKWRLSERQAREYYYKADKEVFEEMSEISRQRLLAQLILKLNGAVDESIQLRQPAAAIGGIAQLAKLCGLTDIAS